MGRERNLIVDSRLADFPILPARKTPISRECIRRLTPLEWERLQGLPDGFTDGQADGPRYRQLGNAVTVPVITAISRAMLGTLGRRTSNGPTIIPRRAGEASPSIPLIAVDLCAGCGGLSQGLVATGAIHVAAACELAPAAASTHQLNHLGTVVVEKDITTEEAKLKVVEALGGKTCDLLTAGLPCQAYSLSGKRNPNDLRGSLFAHFVELVRRLSPRVAVIENVIGILSMRRPDGTPVMDAIARALRELGYATGYRVANSADFGDPQIRTRVVIFGWRQGEIPRFAKTHDEHGRNGLPRWRTVRQAISDIEDVHEDPALWHVFVRSSPGYVERISHTPIGKSVAIGYGESFYRNPPDEPAVTVKANNGGVLVHYSRDRLMTPRELARLQGFPDSYRFAGTKSHVLTQIGNAVPVGLATAIGKAVLGMLGLANPTAESIAVPVSELGVSSLQRLPPEPCPLAGERRPYGYQQEVGCWRGVGIGWDGGDGGDDGGGGGGGG